MHEFGWNEWIEITILVNYGEMKEKRTAIHRVWNFDFKHVFYNNNDGKKDLLKRLVCPYACEFERVYLSSATFFLSTYWFPK